MNCHPGKRLSTGVSFTAKGRDSRFNSRKEEFEARLSAFWKIGGVNRRGCKKHN
jgi:hypothetical protein